MASSRIQAGATESCEVVTYFVPKRFLIILSTICLFESSVLQAGLPALSIEST